MSINKNEELLIEARRLLRQYSDSFSAKVYNSENDEYDPIMNLFNITPELKRENRQYWGRELGMFWERLVIAIFKNTRPDLFEAAQYYGRDEPYDFIVGNYAIDTKYRVGSGDSGTLKKFKQYGEMISNLGYEPVFLMVRDDNLPAAMSAIRQGGWTVYTGEDSFNFISSISGVNMYNFIENFGDEFFINRD